MRIRATVTDYTTLTHKELEKEYVKQRQELLRMESHPYYQNDKSGINCFKMQKELVEYIEKRIKLFQNN